MSRPIAIKSKNKQVYNVAKNVFEELESQNKYCKKRIYQATGQKNYAMRECEEQEMKFPSRDREGDQYLIRVLRI